MLLGCEMHLRKKLANILFEIIEFIVSNRDYLFKITYLNFVTKFEGYVHVISTRIVKFGIG